MPANPSSSLTKRWYVVQAQPGREQLALVHLARQSFESFCPTRLKTLRRGHKHVKVKAPFFPGYLFASLDLDSERWRSINGTIGVMRLVAFGSGGRPTPLPRGFVERLHQLNEGNCPIAGELRAGDRVRVIGGPLDDVCGVLEGASDQQRVTILLSLLGKQTRVSLRRGSLIAA